MSGYQGNIIIKNPATPTGPAENGSAPGVWTLSEALAFKRQGVWPTQGVIPADPYFNYVSMLLSTTSLGNANNNLFVDSSGAFNPISRNGNTTQGSVTPYGANWSNYFDGNSDNLTLPSSASYAIASSSTPFTIEAWIYPTAGGGCVFSEAFTGSGTIPIVISMSTGSSVDGLGGLYIGFGWFTGSAWVTAAIASSAVTANTWTHIACVFTGSTTKIYYNGVDVTKPSSPTPASSWGVTGVAGDGWYVGRRWDGAGSNWFSGYISNLRFVNGTAVYTSNFTPPTAPLTAIANTVLLTCQSNRFRDTSTGNATITVVGDTRVTDFSPFSPGMPGITYNQSDITNWSGYFDGSGDYLSVPTSTSLAFGTGDFTIEFWIYVTADSGDWFPISSIGNGGFFFGQRAGSGWGYGSTGNFWSYNTGTNPVLNTWQHIAISRSGTSLRIFADGTQIGTTRTDSSDWSLATGGTSIGSQGAAYYTTGYISNMRVLKGVGLYTGNFTPPTTNLTAISGTSLLTLQNAAFTDNSTNNFVVTPFGNTTVTGNSPFNTVGYWSNYFNGTNRLSVASNAAFGMGTGDFTVECWINLSAPQSAATKHITDSGTANFMFLKLNTTQIGIGRAQIAEDTMFNYTFNVGTWYHVAFTRSGSTVRGFVDGVQIGSATNSINYATGALTIGNDSNGTQPLGGYLSNLRIVKGTALYTSNFTPPTAPLTVVSNTSILTCQNGRFIDNSTNAFTITVTGSPSVQSFDPFYSSTIASNGGSMYFDGSGDFLTSVSPNFAFGTGAWTVEFWVYPLAYGGSVCGAQLFGTTNGGTSGYSINLGQDINSFRLISNASGSWADNLSVGTGNGPPLNAWSHMVVVRSGANISIYRNGTRVATTGSATSWNFSGTTAVMGRFNDGSNVRDLSGYLSNLRVTGAAVYDPTQSTISVPTAPVNPTAASVIMPNGMNAGIFDATGINDMETVGNAQVSTAVSKYGGSSLYLDGTADYAVSPSSDAFGYGTGDFTIEFWLYLGAAVLQTVVSNLSGAAGTSPHLYTASDGSIRYYTAAGDRIVGSALSTGVWYHIAVSRASGSTKLFINGTQSGSTYADSNNYTTPSPLGIGTYWNGGSQVTTNTLNGYVDDLRITKGYARYTTNFTPPTQPFVTY